MFRVSSPKARSCKGENTHYIDERQNITAQSADFHWGKWCVTSLFCRPSGSSTAQPSPQRATTCQGKGEEAEERALIYSCVNTFCKGLASSLGYFLVSVLLRTKMKRSTMMAYEDLGDWKASVTLHAVHVVVFWTPCGLFLRGQHNLVSSVDAACHGCSQRIQLMWGFSPWRNPGLGFPLPRESVWASWTRSSVSLCACYTFQKSCLYSTDIVYIE